MSDSTTTPTTLNASTDKRGTMGRIALSAIVFALGFSVFSVVKTAEILADAPAITAAAPVSAASRFDYSVNLANRGPIVSAAMSAASAFLSLAPNATPVPPEALAHVFIVRRVESALENTAILAAISALLVYAWPSLSRRFPRLQALR